MIDKVAILTIRDETNFGNQLQNYALQQVLKQYCKKVETLNRYGYGGSETKQLLKYLACPIRVFILWELRKSSKKRVAVKRIVNFRLFARKIKKSKYFFYGEKLRKVNDKYSYFIVGSDQIWNSKFFPNLSINCLSFVESEKRVAYAPSIGMLDISKEAKEVFQRELQYFSLLSCREKAGAELLKEITGRDVTVTLDPTLLLSAKEWERVEKKPGCHKEKKYLLLYFLGEITRRNQEFIDDTAKRYGYEIINIYDQNSSYYSCGPAQFVYMIHHAEMVFTDSFHACVFSTIFQKPFLAFRRIDKRQSMMSRMESLFETLALPNHIYEEGYNLEKLFDFDYTKTNELLQKEQEKSIRYLKTSLGIE